MKKTYFLIALFSLFVLLAGCSNTSGGDSNGGGGGGKTYTISLDEYAPNTISLTLTGGVTWKNNLEDVSKGTWVVFMFSYTQISGNIIAGAYMNYEITRISDTVVTVKLSKYMDSGTGTMKISNLIIGDAYFGARRELFVEPDSKAKWAIGKNDPVTIIIE